MARSTPEIPNASMADIAFLLLTFFLVTTTMPNNKGLSIALPPPPEVAPPDDVKIQERNMFKIQINSSDALLIEGEPREDISTLKEEIKAFVLNNGQNPASSDNPEKAIVSFKTDRGTSHKRFIQLLDIIQGAYYDIYADQAGVTNAEFREAASDLTVPKNKEIYEKGRAGIPLNISIADPTKVGN
ncbi:MAG TPA: biopolymer transporter ExbD [Cyclobacteriaceae bacterium]|jgi:biopolymer transport protein ExbD|nr:biopolymer transporter ExbD [Cytophagales bacterium]HMR58132.1 biopolymer transporter ExbD [Cyclobacteriaceae bacterium]HNT50079.1 biopolymer transporter ExbD [Cyclobacteriaceae bacterium]